MADVQLQLSRVFPGVRFVYLAEEPPGAIETRKHMPLTLRLWLMLFGVKTHATPAGLSYFDVIDLIAGVASKARIVGLDLVELVPERDVQTIRAICAARIICNAIGCAAKQKL
ncbi:arginase family protein [Bradyrhizobium sp. 4]|uniref:arginase family protein n=1 Tax=unclassified Bradyrhizobium TaxID=2631580 RepID=UPI001FFB4392|nr:arginase family protein [Bradyrhizobium sp. 4]